MDISKYPINERNYTVIPCISLVPENMSDDLIGFSVTIGLSEVGVPTSSGVIKKWDEDHIWITVGSKTKKMKYDPEDIQLQVYQFDKRIMFSNEVVLPKKKHKEEKPDAKSPETAPESSESVKETKAPSPTKRKRKAPQKAAQKRTASSEKKPTKSASESGHYKPKFGIVWG